ncbi:MAG: bifunctional 5,10-methylenetetrahydrofolate dehydrogenase/5,10-methenyltetrahydrofolate cyclohydrolase, partial [Candidatus Buchananbacteria bacterium]|nr:bifunctional 5,10-methylenetetrahydrofolate dehydrogenase/5,10-methenyltetrahydrofolate cyclohydrolase [Candidatus Buchananbacteria bacterium]
LAAILVGEDKNSMIFLRQKKKACEFAGVVYQFFQFSGDISQESLEAEIKKIVRGTNHGIIIQLPLPRHINAQNILDLIPPEKDVDVLSGKKIKPTILSPVLAGILALLKEYKINFHGKKVAVVGRGRLVGQPVINWLKKQRIEISDDIKRADILISGAGKPKLIKGDMIKKGTVVVDAAGDVDFKTVEPKASYITPIPGGVGPMTVVMVIKNLMILNEK